MFLPPKNSIPKTLIGQSRHLLDDDGTGTYDKNIDIQSSTKQSVLSTSRLQRSPVTFKDQWVPVVRIHKENHPSRYNHLNNSIGTDIIDINHNFHSPAKTAAPFSEPIKPYSRQNPILMGSFGRDPQFSKLNPQYTVI